MSVPVVELATTDERIEIRVAFDLPPVTVWRALVDPAAIGRWWGDRVLIEPRPGGRFEERWRDGDREVLTSGRVMRFEPLLRLELSWADEDWERRTRVQFRLAATGSGCDLHLLHDGWGVFDEERRAGLIAAHADGWRDHMERLADYLGRG